MAAHGEQKACLLQRVHRNSDRHLEGEGASQQHELEGLFLP